MLSYLIDDTIHMSSYTTDVLYGKDIYMSNKHTSWPGWRQIPSKDILFHMYGIRAEELTSHTGTTLNTRNAWMRAYALDPYFYILKAEQH